MPETKRKTYIVGAWIFISLCFLYIGYQQQKNFNTQLLTMKAVTKEAVKENTDKLEGTFQQKLTDVTLEKGSTYELRITYSIVEKKGDKLLGKAGGRDKITGNATLGCSPLEMTKTFTAEKKYLDVRIILSVTPFEISDGNGGTFNPVTQMLCPVFELEKK